MRDPERKLSTEEEIIDRLQKRLIDDIESDGPILLWTGSGKFPGGTYCGLNLTRAKLKRRYFDQEEIAGLSETDTAPRRAYPEDVMRECWEFVHHNFDRFLDLLRWLDGLEEASYRDQVESLHSIAEHRKKEDHA